jgi:hypothetical protein
VPAARPAKERSPRRRTAREAVGLVAYCGLYCGDCFWYSGGVAELARRTEREIVVSGFDRFARYITRHRTGRAYREFPAFRRVLATIAKKGCTRPCRKGGCDPDCAIRRCCKARKLDGCWQCDRVAVCPGIAELRPIHGAGALRNLRLLARNGPAAFARGRRWWATKPTGPLDRSRGATMLGR